MCFYVDVNYTKDILLLHFLKFINGLQFKGVQIQTDLKQKTTKTESFRIIFSNLKRTEPRK